MAFLKRGQEILGLLEKHKYLRTWMIAQQFYTYRTGKNKAGTIMKKLYDNKMVKRFRLDTNENIYYLGNKSNKWTHWDNLNTSHFKMMEKGIQILYYNLEFFYKYGRADGFYCVDTGEKRIKFFLEVDNGGEMDKISRYEKLYRDPDWQSSFIADPLNSGIISFPIIVILTERDGWKMIETDLVVKVYTLQEFIKRPKELLLS